MGIPVILGLRRGLEEDAGIENDACDPVAVQILGRKAFAQQTFRTFP